MNDRRASVAIIGGGYAGLTAAVDLVDRGIPVTLYESARELGGRARRVQRHGVSLDNGQHILIGAYTRTQHLMRRLGVPDTHFLRLPLQWAFPPEFELRAVRAPAPWHLALGLLAARGLSVAARVRCAAFLQACQRTGFRLASDRTVSTLLQEHRQDRAAIRFLWEPLCLAALNTPLEQASAQIFLNVVKDGLAAGRSASDLLLPAVDLTSLLPLPAWEYLRTRGGEVRTGCPVRRIVREGRDFAIETHAETHMHRCAIVATAPQHVPALAGHMPELATPLDRIRALDYQSIATVYLHYRRPARLPRPMLGLSAAHGQWLFDRSRISGHDGLVAVVISAYRPGVRLGHDELAERVHSEISPHLGHDERPDWFQVIEEKRATFACVPDLERPEQRTAIDGLCLAGDYTAGDYPATIEAAVRSGEICARLAYDAMRA